MIGLLLLALLPLTSAAQARGTMPAASPEAVDGPRVLDILTLEIDGDVLSISPDGRWLAGAVDNRFCVWELPALTPTCGDKPMPLDERSVAWSPDGTAVAFSLDALVRLYDSDIHVLDLETGELANLTDDGYLGDVLSAPEGTPFDLWPIWTQDGQELVFTRATIEDPAARTVLMRIPRNGGEPVEITASPVPEPFSVWLPPVWAGGDVLLVTFTALDPFDPVNGIRQVALTSGTAERIVLGAEIDVHVPSVVAVTDEGWALVHLYLAAVSGGALLEAPVIFMVDLATGKALPTPVSAIPSTGRAVYPHLRPLLVGDRVLLPTVERGTLVLHLWDPATGEVEPVEIDGEIPGAFLPVTLTDDGTLLLSGPDGAMLARLEPVPEEAH